MSSELKKIAESLQESEFKVLKYLRKEKSDYASKISSKTKLSTVQVNRSALWLKNKDLVKIDKKTEEFVELGKLGKKYVKDKLPERRFIDALKKPSPLNEIKKKASLDKQEAGFSIGYLKKKGWIELGKKISKTKNVKSETLEEKLLKKLSKNRLKISELKPEEKHALEALKKRKEIVETSKETSQKITITDKGKKVSKIPVKIKKRRYDVSSPVPKIYPGKKQAYRAFHDQVKKELISMSFEEMTGPAIESCFYNCDALFMPQDHPARGIHDLYFINKKADSKEFSKYLPRVKKVHEKGWGYKFDKEQSSKMVLRSQGTALSARMLANAKVPGKYFALAKCYRPDVVDPTHLTEFYQLEGIVVGEDLNFRNLLSLLKEFCKKIAGTNKVKFLPGYFPFTEPSVEGFVYHKKLKKWIEILPGGIFRPEVTKPFGIDVPVLAWGIGFDRLFMIKEGIEDIRDLFSYDIDFLREAKL